MYAQFTIVDGAMFIPMDSSQQVCIFVHKIKEQMFLDVRIWVKGGQKFVPSKRGIRIPLRFISQLTQRLEWLDKKYGEKE